jgi:hypothetical protein
MSGIMSVSDMFIIRGRALFLGNRHLYDLFIEYHEFDKWNQWAFSSIRKMADY